jgi:putative ABC transport system permease protein
MHRRLWALITALAFGSGGAQAQAPLPSVQASAPSAASPLPAHRAIAIDARLAERASLSVGDTAIIAATAGSVGDTVIIAAITQRSADPSEVARSEYRVRLHLDHLQRLTGAGDRVGRFAVSTRDTPGAIDSAAARINALAFGFRAYRAADVAVETSATFRVVNRFHRAIGVITIVASAIFLLCITLLKVDERRRDVGALRLIGLSRSTIVRAVMLEASFIALLGSLMGVVLGYAAGWFVNWHYQGLYATPLRFAIVTPSIVLFATLLSLGLGVIAGYVAAQRLVRQAPLALVGR